jgi:MoaA/NifB/PqqE/SkfB family radical SAM enzyme
MTLRPCLCTGFAEKEAPVARSPNPDLIFSDILTERARRVARTYEQDGYSGKDFQLDRVTLFLTHRCNLKCSYCNGPHIHSSWGKDERLTLLRAETDVEKFSGWLKDWSRHGLKHIHLTGGEATLRPNLVELVSMAASRGILVSLTSNGAARPGLYQRLVEAGLSELRISLDMAQNSEIDRVVGVAGAAERILENVRQFVEWKSRTRASCFLILNTCVGMFNLHKLREILDGLIELEPDDIKLLVIAEDADFVCSHSSGRKLSELLAFTHRRRPDYDRCDR